MKRIVPIFLVFLTLFNAMGFYGLLQGLRYKSTRDLVQRLDDQRYSAEETVTIKVPIAIPYQPDAEDYERVDGEIEYKGEVYRLVKQKFESDTLYIVCIRDHASKRINQALADYVKTFADHPVQGKHTSKGLSSFIKDFLPTSLKISHASAGWTCSFSVDSFFSIFYNRSISVITPPPQA